MEAKMVSILDQFNNIVCKFCHNYDTITVIPKKDLPSGKSFLAFIAMDIVNYTLTSRKRVAKFLLSFYGFISKCIEISDNLTDFSRI